MGRPGLAPQRPATGGAEKAHLQLERREARAVRWQVRDTAVPRRRVGERDEDARVDEAVRREVLGPESQLGLQHGVVDAR